MPNQTNFGSRILRGNLGKNHALITTFFLIRWLLILFTLKNRLVFREL